MATRSSVLQEIATYFKNKGKILNIAEYKRAIDKPVSMVMINRAFGNYKRMLNRIAVHYAEIQGDVAELEAKQAAREASAKLQNEVAGVITEPEKPKIIINIPPKSVEE